MSRLAKLLLFGKLEVSFVIIGDFREAAYGRQHRICGLSHQLRGTARLCDTRLKLKLKQANDIHFGP